MAAVLFGLKHFRTYLLGQRFTIRTDHMAIKHYQTAPSLGGQQQRYLDYMSYYDFDVEYRPGKLHTNADAVSRMPPCEINDGEPCKQCHKRVTCVHVNTVATRARNKNRTVVQQQDFMVILSTQVREGKSVQRRGPRLSLRMTKIGLIRALTLTLMT